MGSFSRHAISFQCFHVVSGCISDSALTTCLYLRDGKGLGGREKNKHIKHRSENSVWFFTLKHSAVLLSTYFSGRSAWILI